MQRVPYRINPRRNTPRHILIKLSKIKYKENLPNLGKEKDIQVQEAQRVADRINSKKTTPRHTVIKNGKN